MHFAEEGSRESLGLVRLEALPSFLVADPVEVFERELGIPILAYDRCDERHWIRLSMRIHDFWNINRPKLHKGRGFQLVGHLASTVECLYGQSKPFQYLIGICQSLPILLHVIQKFRVDVDCGRDFLLLIV